jgi:CubicO group peptidase (beta-lactamase class C family)
MLARGIAAFCTLMVVCSCVARASDPRDLGPILEKVRDQTKAPGLAAAIIRDGKLAGVGVAGVRKLGEEQKVERGDLLMIGSCGKSLTRLLLGRLIDKGLLRIDSTLRELLPDVDMRDEYTKVTIAQLIAHRGGIQPYTEIGPQRTPKLFALTGAPTEQRAAFAAILLAEAPSAPPGTREVYSNAGYGLLGHIAERLAKRPYEDALREFVFEPLGMKSAVVAMPNSTPQRVGLTGHMREGETYRPAPRIREPLAAIAPAGMMSCSIDDFARFAAVLAACEADKPGDFLKPATVAAIREARPGGKSVDGVPFFGGDGFYTAAFALWPSAGTAIVVGSNAGESDEVCQAAIDAVREACAPELSKTPAGMGGGPRAARDAGGSDAADANRTKYGFSIRGEDTGSQSWYVQDIVPDSIAARSGLKDGDQIIELNGMPLEKIEPDKRIEQVRKSPLKLTVLRDGKRVEIELK